MFRYHPTTTTARIMDAALQHVHDLEARLAQAKVALEAEREREMTVADVLDKLPDAPRVAKGITCTGAALRFDVPPGEYDIGTASLPMRVYRRAKVLDFTHYISGIFQAPGTTLFEQVANFFDDKWDDVRRYDLYVLPINLEAKTQGRKKCDLPNVTFAIVTQMLLKKIRLVIVDPIHKGTDATVNVVDLTRVLRKLQDARVKIPLPYEDKASDDALDLVFYQRGGGDPNPTTEAQILAATGLTKQDIMHMHLAPGKYEQGQCTWGGNCYRDFVDSAALILHELRVVVPFCDARRKRALHRLYFVLDEFSGFAMYTAVAILAYGIGPAASVLAYRRGVYTPMPPHANFWLT